MTAVNPALVELITRFEPTATDADIFAALSAPSLQTTDHTLYTFRQLIQIIGPDMTSAVLGKLKAAAASNPLLDATYLAVCSSGIDFADPVTQEQVDALVTASVFTAEEGTALKAVGVQARSSLEANGLSDITEEVIHDTRANSPRLNGSEKLRWLYNTHIHSLESGEITWAEVQAIAASI